MTYSASYSPPAFRSTLAHPADQLPEHLRRVTEQAANKLAACGEETRRIAVVAGLCHDIGKATAYFQEYLNLEGERSELTTHARCGALWAWWASARLSTWERMAATVAVLRHHGKLGSPWREELSHLRQEVRDGRALHRQLDSMDVAGAASFLIGELGAFTVPAPSDTLREPSQLLAERIPSRFALPEKLELDKVVEFLAAFGSLVTSDRVDTALEGESIERRAIPENAVAGYKEHIIGSPATALDHRRVSISDEVERTLGEHPKCRLFTLTSPTGSGKTLTVLNAALKRRVATTASGVAPRIIYCLPFTSVIDQNERVFAGVLEDAGLRCTSNLLLKHHHLSDRAFSTDENEYESDGPGTLLTETWQSEVVVTTFHQLLHSLLSARSADLKRAGQLAGAIVLLDEVQAIPRKYWDSIGRLLEAVSERLGTTFILLTATRPLILGDDKAIELLQSHREHFEAMSRTNLVCRHRDGTPISRFADQLAESLRDDKRACLVILNRKRAVESVWSQLRNALPDRKVKALSTNLTPKDRLARIKSIHQALDSGESIVVVSTQLVEAGVDFSFPVVHRDLAPLDCIIQSAGRCNRSATADSSSVFLWKLLSDDADRPLWHRIYDPVLIEATTDAIGDRAEVPEAGFLDLADNYFSLCAERGESDPVDALLEEGKFADLDKRFQLIERRPTQSCFVCLNQEDEVIWRLYDAWRNDRRPESRKAFRARERDFFERIVQVFSRDRDDEVQLVTGTNYHPELGLTAPIT